MDNYIIHDQIHQVLICRQHHYAISSDAIARHFRELHKAIPLEIRQRIIQYTKGLDLLKVKKVNVPPDMISIHGLTVRITLRGYFF